MTTYNLAELFESIVDPIPDRLAIVAGDRRLTYGELDERANRLANHLRDAGIEPGDHVGLHLVNSTEYIEAMLAAFKLRAVPVNINYRYVERELEHLYAYMDLVALIVHRQFATTVGAVSPSVPTLRHIVVVDDGSDAATPDGWVEYEGALAAASSVRDFEGRNADDIYVACTGGTTGMPKGVLWRHEDIFFASLGGGDPAGFFGAITEPDELAARLGDAGLSMLVTPPLMHVSAHWGAFTTFYGGGTVVLLPPGPFDGDEVLRLVEEEKVNVVVVVGNAMATPLADALATTTRDTSSLISIGSGGALLSASVKDRIREHLPNALIIDGFGSTETGVAGNDSGVGAKEGRQGVAFRMDDRTAVLDDDLEPVAPGTGQVGRVARRGRIPLGYYNDAEKTAATFVEKDGVRWVLPGDLASVEDDGAIVLHGRGSVSINTGGEKVFPEEVESALISHPAIADVLVVGVPDDRWGQRVVAVATVRGAEALDISALQEHARKELAGYKVPRDLVVVDAVPRGPNGKPDYAAARDAAIAALG